MSKNKEIINTPEGQYLQSYDKNIAFIPNDTLGKRICLDSQYWSYSKTTTKHLGQFLGEVSKDIREKIDKGIYKLINLN